MGLFNKDKKEKEPQYYMSATNMPTYNYKVYYLSLKEKILYFLLAFVVGAVVGYLFYGGMAKDQFGDPTQMTHILNVVICTLTGGVAGFLYLPMRTQQILDSKRNNLKLQFRELLDALATSIGSGKNITDSFKSAYDDLSIIYSEDAMILKELALILDGINNIVYIELT